MSQSDLPPPEADVPKGCVVVREQALPCWCEADCFEDGTVCYCGCHALVKKSLEPS